MVDLLGPIDSANDLVTRDDARNASNLASGTVATARLGSGTADGTTFLRGDSTWQNFNTAVQANRLDQMTTPTASVAMGSQKLTGLAAGTTAGDSVRYEQVLLLAGGTMTGNLDSSTLARLSTTGTLALGDTATQFLDAANRGISILSSGTNGINEVTLRASGNSNASYINTQGSEAGGTMTRLRIGATTGGTELRTVSNHNMVLHTNNTERMRVAADGVVSLSAGNPLVVNATSVTNAGTLLEVRGPDSFQNPLVFIGSSLARAYTITFRNNTGIAQWFVALTSNQFITGTAAGDSGFRMTSSNTFHLGGSASVVAVTSTNSLGFHNSTPIAKPTVSGSRGGNAALDSLLTALANYGLITNSTSA